MDKHITQIGSSIIPVRRGRRDSDGKPENNSGIGEHGARIIENVEPEMAFSARETCRILGGISSRSLRRLEQRGLLKPSRGLRKKLYLRSDLIAYLEGTR